MFLKPDEVIARFPCTEGMRVGDFGAGVGTYTTLLSSKVGPSGTVYAFDFEPMHIECLGRSCIQGGIKNVFPLRVDLNQNLPLKDELLGAALVVNVLHALNERERFLSELYRTLRPKGQILLVDWVASFKNLGPSEDRVVTPADAERLLRAHGFSLQKTLPAGSHHFAFIAEKI